MFEDRHDAGRRLAARLAHLRGQRPVVLALPRGGVPVGFEIARALGAPLDLVLVRKVGVPWHPELAAGAVADGDEPELVVNDDVVESLGVSRRALEAQAARELAEIERRRERYLRGRERAEVEGRTAIVVDDGVATGATVRAALRSVRRRRPRRLVLAVPVAPPDTLDSLRDEVDEVVCLAAPEDFGAVGSFYADFRQLGDEEVVDFLAKATPSRAPGAPGAGGARG